MKKILSIDFDYFIDTTLLARNTLFPQGSDEVDTHTLNDMWEESYEKYPDIANMGLIPEYRFISVYLEVNRFLPSQVFISDSHKGIKEVIDSISESEAIEVVNIDFHHDNYHYFTGGDSYNCSNWVRRLVEDRPDTQVTWVKRSDSQTDSLEGEFPYIQTKNIFNIFKYEEYDYLFICKSPEWTPPHLYDRFQDLVNIVEGKR